MGIDDAMETVLALRELEGKEVVLVGEFLALVKCNQKTFHIRLGMKNSSKAAKEGWIGKIHIIRLSVNERQLPPGTVQFASPLNARARVYVCVCTRTCVPV